MVDERHQRSSRKQSFFPGSMFLVGSDTVIRLADPVYYGTSEARDRAIEKLTAAGARFLVFGRLMGETFQTLRDLELPARLTVLCEEIP